MAPGTDIEVVHDAAAQQLGVEIVVYTEEEIVVTAVEDNRQIPVLDQRNQVNRRRFVPGFGMLGLLAQQLRNLPVLRERPDVEPAAGTAGRAEQILVLYRQRHGAESAHAQTGNGPSAALAGDGIASLHSGQQLPYHERFIEAFFAHLAVEVPAVAHTRADESDSLAVGERGQRRLDSQPGGFIAAVTVQQVDYRAGEKPRNVVFQEYIESKGYGVDFNTGLAKLEKDADGRITGVIAQNTEDGHFIRIHAAKGVLLACGGYAGNPYMMEQLDPLGTSVTTACSYTPADKGYGIRAAIWAGAHLDAEPAPVLFDRGLVAPGVDAGYVDAPSAFGGKAFPGTVGQYNPGSQPFLKVNRHGERFMNESQEYDNASHASFQQPGHVYAMIHDANYFEDVTRFHTIGCSAVTRLVPGGMEKKLEQYAEEGLIMKADTIEELADKMGFTGADKDNFVATVARYNELYDKQNDEDFGKPAYRLSAIRTAPFYGCWLGASLLCSMQGISITENCQAKDSNNEPIPGLYITGDMSGSFFQNNYPCVMGGTACGRTMTFAIKSIKQMAGLENA